MKDSKKNYEKKIAAAEISKGSNEWNSKDFFVIGERFQEQFF